ncbi:MAG: hypothetical protein JO166_04540 [Deltaproteobacteria bacterium]|nr:hypothetical protein [Deltaproteobacteria bacterium]
MINSGQVDQKEAASIEATVARIRQLDFTRPVPVVVDTPDQAQQAIVAQITRDHSDEDLRIGAESGMMTGLYPPNIDLKRQTVELLRDEVIGFYNPDTKQMVVVQRAQSDASRDADRERKLSAMVFAHELTHALQDQHFAIEELLKRVKDNDDRTLALKCVAEGDATIAGFGYIAGGLHPANVELLSTQLATLPANSAVREHDVALAVIAPMLFEYSAGSRFVAEAWRRGGWVAVDQLYQRPPRSSQQIMQPDLYFDHPTPPLHIDLTGYDRLLPGWKKVDDDTYGELLLKLIFEQNLPPHAQALSILPRWAGDRIITLKKGSQLTLLWLIAFHDQTSAEEFTSAYSRILEHLSHISNPHGVATRAAAVFIAIGPGARDFAQLRDAVWKVSRVAPS